MILNLFPNLSGSWGYLNLNELSRSIETEPNPFLNANYCAQWIKKLHECNKIDCSWGGYMELRDHIWRGSYLTKTYPYSKCPVHLGVDYNVPAGTEVALPVDGEFVESKQFQDQDGGWGGRLLFKCGDHIGIMAHLQLAPIKGKLKKGDIVGTVATPDINGGWYPHLHCQIITAEHYRLCAGDFDGYARTEDICFERFRLAFPNPHLIFPSPQ